MNLIPHLCDPSALQKQQTKLLAQNEKTCSYGLTLTEEDAVMLMEARTESLSTSGRIEFGEGITMQLIDAFYSSPYLTQAHYAETLAALLQLFDLFKNELGDAYNDRELLTFMRDAFDGECAGSLERLENDVFPRLLTEWEYETDSDRGNSPKRRLDAERERIREKHHFEDSEKDGKVYDTVPEVWEDKNGHIL